MKQKKDIVKIKTSEKWKYYESIPLQYLLSTYHCLNIWDISNYILINEKGGNVSISSWIYVKS